MARNNSHYIKRTSRTFTPINLGILTADYKALERNERASHERITASAWTVLYSRLRNGEYETPSIVSGTSKAGLWRYTRELSGSGRKLYLVCEDGSHTATALDLWREVIRGRFSVRPSGAGPVSSVRGMSRAKQRRLPLVMTGRTQIIGLTHDTGTVRIVSPINHGIEIPAQDERTRIERARDLWEKYTRMFAWWRIFDCGPWSDTMGGCGWAWWRKLVPKRSVLEHDQEQAHAAECSAIFGGRQQTFFFGTVHHEGKQIYLPEIAPKAAAAAVLKSRLFHVDIKSNYLSIMRDKPLPVRLIGRGEGTNPDTVARAARVVDIIVRCRISNKRTRFPKRTGERIVFPEGQFLTTLSTPEYLDAHENNEVGEVYEWWRYERGKPTQAWAESVLHMRDIADFSGCRIGSGMAKAFGNALSGRLGKSERTWIERDDLHPPIQWGEWLYSPGPQAPSVRVRVLAGRSFVSVRSDRRVPGLTAIYAHILAYGRQRSAQIIDLAGPKGCISWDTDGGFFSEAGMTNLREIVDPGASQHGFPRLKGTAETGVFRTPQHYWTTDGWILSGVPGTAKIDPDGRMEWSEVINPWAAGIDRHGATLDAHHRTREFRQIGASSAFDSSGWAIPLFWTGSGLVSLPPSELSLG